MHCLQNVCMTLSRYWYIRSINPRASLDNNPRASLDNNPRASLDNNSRLQNITISNNRTFNVFPRVVPYRHINTYCRNQTKNVTMQTTLTKHFFQNIFEINKPFVVCIYRLSYVTHHTPTVWYSKLLTLYLRYLFVIPLSNMLKPCKRCIHSLCWCSICKYVVIFDKCFTWFAR